MGAPDPPPPGSKTESSSRLGSAVRALVCVFHMLEKALPFALSLFLVCCTWPPNSESTGDDVIVLLSVVFPVSGPCEVVWCGTNVETRRCRCLDICDLYCCQAESLQFHGCGFDVLCSWARFYICLSCHHLVGMGPMTKVVLNPDSVFQGVCYSPLPRLLSSASLINILSTPSFWSHTKLL